MLAITESDIQWKILYGNTKFLLESIHWNWHSINNDGLIGRKIKCFFYNHKHTRTRPINRSKYIILSVTWVKNKVITCKLRRSFVATVRLKMIRKLLRFLYDPQRFYSNFLASVWWTICSCHIEAWRKLVDFSFVFVLFFIILIGCCYCSHHSCMTLSLQKSMFVLLSLITLWLKCWAHSIESLLGVLISMVILSWFFQLQDG